MLRDRFRLRRRLQQLRRDPAQASDRAAEQLLAKLLASAEKVEQRRKSVPKVEYPDLPVSGMRDEIVAAIREHQVVVVCGETGSGKTTQLPKMCLEAGRGVVGTIGHTQPRRIAARTVAARIAEEMKTPLGELVGYKVRFNDKTSPKSLVKLMTDGMLLAEVQGDRFLNQYDTIIVDEAHERSLNIDFLLGHLRNLCDRRPELKLVITSATIDPDRFSRHFDGCPVINVSGRTYPVEVRYNPLHDEATGETGDMIDGIVQAVDELGRDPTVGRDDTLVFLSGEREIREAAKALEDHGGARHGHAGRYDVLPLYARLSHAEQNRVFKPTQRRRIVLATNVAETSLTVPGIRSVIDTGVVRMSRYSARSKVQRLPIEPVSQASAEQRKGRCGRVGDGVCVRLFSEEDFTSRPEYTDPEIQRTNLAAVILQMRAFGLGDVESFPFIDPPDMRQVRDGYQTLLELGALDEHRNLTDVGRLLAKMPIDPKLSRIVLAAEKENCLEEIIIIATALSIQDPRERPMEKQKEADTAHAQWKAGGSDFLSLLNLWRWYRQTKSERSNSKLRAACRDNFVNYLRMLEWGDLQRQLREVVSGFDWKLNRQDAGAEQIHRSIVAGLLSNVGRKGDGNEYTGVRGRKFFLFPGSVCFSSKPQWTCAAELVETTRLYARTVCTVKPEWIEEAAGHLVKKTYGEPHWQKKTGRVVAQMKVTLFGLPIAKRNVDYGKIDPKKSRSIFIKSALVDGDFESGSAFFRHNQQLVRDIELVEAKTRRRDIMVDPETQFSFYDAKVGAAAVDQRSFDEWRQSAEKSDRRLLYMQPEDLMARTAADAEGGLFPDTIDAGPVTLKLAYRFDPGHKGDGVTATVPLGELHVLDAARLDWLVPGLIEEKVADLIRTLPKNIRREFVPVPETAHRVALQLDYGTGALLPAMCNLLSRTGVTVQPADFNIENLDPYLRMNLRVVNEHGKAIAFGRDIEQLRKKLRVEARSNLADLPDPTWNRDNLKRWEVGDLPRRVELKVAKRTVQGFPALLDRGDSVSLRLLESEPAALVAHRRGVRRLLLLDYAKEIRYQVNEASGSPQMRLHYTPLGDVKKLKEHLAEAVGDKLFLGTDPAAIRTEQAFEEASAAAWAQLGSASREVASVAADILARRHAVHLKLSKPVTDILRSSVNDMREQLAHLVPADFLLRTPPMWLGHVPRYLQAISVRHDKLLSAGLEKDSRSATAVFPFWKAYLDRLSDREAGPLNPKWITFRWLLEEYRVSLFAQKLGTATKVSEKVLRDYLPAGD